MDPAPDDDLSLRTLVRQLIVGVALFTIGVGALGYAFGAWIEKISQWFVGEFGLLGIFLGVAFLDTIPGTFHEPLLLMGYTGGLGFVPVWIAASTGSILSGFLGYGIGAALSTQPRLHAILERYRINEFMRRYGTYAIIVAALTPIPYSLSTWGAGATRIPLTHLFVGALFRIPKVGFYLGLIALGWAAST